MKKTFFISVVFIMLHFPSYAMSDQNICDIRASTMEAVAVERDAGKSKKQVKAMVKKNFGSNLPSSFDAYLDIVYKEKDIKPSGIKNVFLYSCYKEFGLIK